MQFLFRFFLARLKRVYCTHFFLSPFKTLADSCTFLFWATKVPKNGRWLVLQDGIINMGISATMPWEYNESIRAGALLRIAFAVAATIVEIRRRFMRQFASKCVNLRQVCVGGAKWGKNKPNESRGVQRAVLHALAKNYGSYHSFCLWLLDHWVRKHLFALANFYF